MTLSHGRDRSSSRGRRRASTWNCDRTSRRFGRTDSDIARYQSRVSPEYQATPTAHRGAPGARSHMVTAPRPESRNRRRIRKAATRPTSSSPSRTSRAVVTGNRLSTRGPRGAQASGSGVLAGGAEPGLGAACGSERIRVVAVGLRPAQGLTGPLHVDLLGELGGLGQDGHTPVGDRQEPAVGGHDEVLTGPRAGPHPTPRPPPPRGPG